MEAGGLALLPVGILGVLGLLRCLRAPRRHGLWLLLAAAGLAPTALSATTARRLLVFDAAWCALAAHGVLALVDSRLLRASSPRTTGWGVAGGWPPGMWVARRGLRADGPDALPPEVCP